MKCVCEEPGPFNCGHKGILAHIENGKATTAVERCDQCKTYASDKEAQRSLRSFLKMIPVAIGVFKKGMIPVTIGVSKKAIQQQIIELNRYFALNEGHLSKSRQKNFDGIYQLLVSIRSRI